MNKRLTISIITGALLGVLCIIGISYRLGVEGNEWFLAANWINRVLIGLVIGLAGKLKLHPALRGILLGSIVSFSLYIATDFRDPAGFGAGIVYGLIIDLIATKYSRKHVNH